MLFSELYKIMVDKVTCVGGLRGVIGGSSPLLDHPWSPPKYSFAERQAAGEAGWVANTNMCIDKTLSTARVFTGNSAEGGWFEHSKTNETNWTNQELLLSYCVDMCETIVRSQTMSLSKWRIDNGTVPWGNVSQVETNLNRPPLLSTAASCESNNEALSTIPGWHQAHSVISCIILSNGRYANYTCIV